jgi:hypothetical protein
MSVGNLSSSISMLRDANEKLKAAWLRTSEVWNDPNSHHFEEQCLAPLEPKLRTALEAAGRMSEVLTKMQRDCE